MTETEGGFFVSLTRGREDPERATVALTMAVTAAASGKKTVWILTMGAVEWALQGNMEGVAVPGLTALSELYQQFRELDGKVWVCTPCFKRRALDEALLLPEAELVGGASVVELLSGGVPALSY
jgi:predicted peroxiredoxin